MVFTEDSVIVQAWISLVLTGTYTREQVPNIYNLREVVYGVLDSLVA